MVSPDWEANDEVGIEVAISASCGDLKYMCIYIYIYIYTYIYIYIDIFIYHYLSINRYIYTGFE